MRALWGASHRQLTCANSADAPLSLSFSCVPQALADAGLEASQIAAVEVVGGTTRVPAVAQRLTDFFGGLEPSRTLNSKETVSRGCALQCAMLSPTFKVRDFQVLDSFPYGVQFRCGGVVVVGLAGDGWGWHRGRGQEVVGVMGQESAVCLPAAASPCLIQCILDPLA